MIFFNRKRANVNLEFRTLSSLVLEVTNLQNIALVSPSQIKQLKKLILSHPVIIIRTKRKWNEKEQICFTEKFGELDTPVIYSTLNPSDREVRKRWPNAQLSGLQWHSDRSYMHRPPHLSFFQMIEKPPNGNETLFVNLIEAYQELGTDTVKKWKNYVISYANDDVKHPLLWIHPYSGNKSIYFDFRFASKIIDNDQSNGKLKLVDTNQVMGKLENLFSETTIYNHQWQKGDLLIVDNYASAHKANIGPCHQTSRVIFRTSTKGVYF